MNKQALLKIAKLSNNSFSWEESVGGAAGAGIGAGLGLLGARAAGVTPDPVNVGLPTLAGSLAGNQWGRSIHESRMKKHRQKLLKISELLKTSAMAPLFPELTKMEDTLKNAPLLEDILKAVASKKHKHVPMPKHAEIPVEEVSNMNIPSTLPEVAYRFQSIKDDGESKDELVMKNERQRSLLNQIAPLVDQTMIGKIAELVKRSAAPKGSGAPQVSPPPPSAATAAPPAPQPVQASQGNAPIEIQGSKLDMSKLTPTPMNGLMAPPPQPMQAKPEPKPKEDKPKSNGGTQKIEITHKAAMIVKLLN